MGKNKEMSCRINHEISQKGVVSEVRIIGSFNYDGIHDLSSAIRFAEDTGVDLIEINESSNPPVCKLMDYNKFLYEQKKKKKELEKNSKKNEMEIKELRFGPNTDTHDFDFKKKHAENFLNNGDKVKAVVIFHGREMNFKDKGEIMLLKLAEELTQVGLVESMPKFEGNKMIMFIKPKK